MKMMNEMKTSTYWYNNESYDFNFYTNLSTADKARFVNSVVGLMVNDEEYNSVIRDIVFDFFTIRYFTDIDTSTFVNAANFIDAVEDFLLSTNIVEIVKANAFPTLFNELNMAVDKSIEYKTGIHSSSISDALASLLSTLEKKINEVDLDSMMGMAQKFAGMGEDFTMENLVNAYMSSDVHKKNLAEIMEAKKDAKGKKGEIGKKTKKNKTDKVETEVVETEKVDM